ncbi:MAG TPA: VOC family protein [Streptosporangiaceae bacterium]|nr:VOC family protein [Streptosporangiaceae bacterium]
MTETNVTFRSFAVIRLAVADLDAAVSAWTDQLGWPPATTAPDLATFPLGATTIEMVPATAGQVPGVIAVAVTVDDTEQAAQRIESAGFRVERTADHSVVLPARDLNGVALELRPADEDGPESFKGPYTRINHVVVAVEDDDAAQENWAAAFGRWPAHAMGGHDHFHHVPVGIAWFGLTASGTNASALGRFIDRRGEGVYALGVVVDDWAQTLETLRTNGARLITQEDSNQTFLHPATTHGVLINLVAEWHPDLLPAG